MSFGLLPGAFRTKGDFCSLRCVARQREMLTAYQSRHIQHMQKALTQMDIRLGQAISDVAGEMGLKGTSKNPFRSCFDKLSTNGIR